MIKLSYQSEDGATGRTIEVTLDYDNLDYILENMRWFLSMVYMWDVGKIDWSLDEGEAK